MKIVERETVANNHCAAMVGADRKRFNPTNTQNGARLSPGPESATERCRSSPNPRICGRGRSCGSRAAFPGDGTRATAVGALNSELEDTKLGYYSRKRRENASPGRRGTVQDFPDYASLASVNCEN